MKKKVNINREKVSSGEIQSRRNFGSLVKNYTEIGNPYRKTSWRTKSILWVTLVSAVLVYIVSTEKGCNEHEVYREYNKDFSTLQWNRAKAVSFTPEIADTACTYKLKLVFRHVEGFQFQDLAVKISSSSPSGKTSTKDYIVPVMKDNKFVGDCTGDMCDLESVIETSIRLQEKGKYTFTVEHNMPVDVLPNVMEVGLIIEKNP